MDRTLIDALLRTSVDRGHLPGVAATAANRDGPIYEGAFGARNVGTGAAMAPDSVIWIASMTKAVTCLAALQLVERGALDLDAPLVELLPELDETRVLDGFGPDGAPRLRPPARPIALKHLLTHTAGFGYDVWNAELSRYVTVSGVPPIASGRNAALRMPLTFDPGERWQYGISIDWVGKAVEAASGTKLGAYFTENIFNPLGMVDTAFLIRPDMRARLARVHVRDAAGALVATETEIRQTPQFEMGGGGLYSTVRDYLRFARALLGGGVLDGARILSPEMTARAMRNQIGALSVTRMPSSAPAVSHDVELFPGVPKTWGFLGMINDEPAPTARSAGAIAWAGLANTYWWVDPGRGLAGVMATQLLPFADPAALDLLAGFEMALH